MTTPQLRANWRAAVERELARPRPLAYRAVVDRLVRRAIRKGDEPVGEIAAAYEALLHLEPAGVTRQRRSSGSYYTPQPLIDCLLDRGLEPLLDRMGDPARIRVADPACGDGRFLLAAAQRIARRGVPMVQVVSECLFGVDTDRVAVELCRAALAEAGSTAARNVNFGDGLTAWKPGAFDAVIGNPPFRNGIEGERLTVAAHPLIRGAADIAYRFFARALDLARPGGIVAFIQPRPVLNAAAMWQFRSALRPGFRTNLIVAPEDSRLFSGALVFTCGIVLGPAELCAVSRDGAHWAEGCCDNPNWWIAFNELLDGPTSARDTGPPLGDVFDIAASMTVADAYDLEPFLVENQRAKRGRLVTTGLLDPEICLWGRRRCRYLGRDLTYPAIARGAALSPSLNKRLARSLRPKILVAGLSKRMECWFDECGQSLGAVSTFTIVHPEDDLPTLRRLVDWLHSREIDRRFHGELGANAVGGGDIVMRKQFLRDLRGFDC